MPRVHYEESSDPRWERILSALKVLCQKGAKPYWIREAAPVLLTLESVRRSQGPNGASGGPHAVVQVLRELVGSFREESQGVVLWIVLALEEVYVDGHGMEHHLHRMSAHDRRELAGMEFREGEDQVRGGTIRQLHEPHALRRLTALMIRRENELTGAPAVDMESSLKKEASQRARATKRGAQETEAETAGGGTA